MSRRGRLKQPAPDQTADCYRANPLVPSGPSGQAASPIEAVIAFMVDLLEEQRALRERCDRKVGTAPHNAVAPVAEPRRASWHPDPR